MLDCPHTYVSRKVQLTQMCITGSRICDLQPFRQVRGGPSQYKWKSPYPGTTVFILKRRPGSYLVIISCSIVNEHTSIIYVTTWVCVLFTNPNKKQNSSPSEAIKPCEISSKETTPIFPINVSKWRLNWNIIHGDNGCTMQIWHIFEAIVLFQISEILNSP